MLLEFFPELIRVDENSQQYCCIQQKNSLRNFLGMFKALQFLRLWVYRKILLDFIVELIRGRSELSTELLDLKKNPFEIFWVCSKYCSFLDFEFVEKCY